MQNSILYAPKPIPQSDLPLYASLWSQPEDPNVLVTHKTNGGIARLYDNIEAAHKDPEFHKMTFGPNATHVFYDLAQYRKGNVVQSQSIMAPLIVIASGTFRELADRLRNQSQNDLGRKTI